MAQLAFRKPARISTSRLHTALGMLCPVARKQRVKFIDDGNNFMLMLIISEGGGEV